MHLAIVNIIGKDYNKQDIFSTNEIVFSYRSINNITGTHHLILTNSFLEKQTETKKKKETT